MSYNKYDAGKKEFLLNDKIRILKYLIKEIEKGRKVNKYDLSRNNRYDYGRIKEYSRSIIRSK
jgi:hypothetical protein